MDRKSQGQLPKYLAVCREYNVALRIELKRKEMKDDAKRTAELAAYFTHAKLQPVHQVLSDASLDTRVTRCLMPCHELRTTEQHGTHGRSR